MSIGLGIGFNFGFPDRPKPDCGCNEKWIPIQNLDMECLQQVAKFALEEHHKKHWDNWALKGICGGWYLEIDAYSVKYRLHIEVSSRLGFLKRYEVIVFEKRVECGRIRSLESFRHI